MEHNQNSKPKWAGNIPAVHRDAGAFITAPLESVSIGIPLDHSVYVKVGENFILFRPQGDVLTQKRWHSLKEKTDSLFIPKEEWKIYLDTLDDIRGGSLLPGESQVEKEGRRLRQLMMAYQQEIERAGVLYKAHVKKCERLGSLLSNHLKDNPSQGAGLLRKYKDPSLYFVNHSVNVAIYAAAIGHKLNIVTRDVDKLAFSTLVHNVGNLFIPREILYKPGELTRDEWNVVKLHPRRGAELLETFYVPREAILTTMQHHERIDGGGYPAQASGKHIHLFARICTIADVFDALTNKGPYQLGMVPTSAVEKMRHMQGKFDSQILNMIGS